ncbi:Mammalian cell entry related domain protein [Chlorobaculum parvum NCIB 8327]|uniref:Mammalian cell entry related domain protein n=1 Tax=Chlorobaculum parvum (strain DSM 263 / NCIMB 8327) TaxID=517417 RepID=B3QQ99_CHLP8|nr:MlaD family protein [Chlorobaculum parvum]ACF12102.1 Mammalian cell entry related domain protein [Chlorobaculum parvum NCIB 8327]
MRNLKELKWSDLKTGIFFLLGLGFAAYLGLVIGRNTSVFTGVTTIKIMTENVNGLAENNFVAVAGKKIGTVSSLNFATENDSLFVVANLKLQNEYANLVTKDSKASIRSLGVLGDKYVDIKAGTGKPVKEGDFIQLVPEDGLSALTDNAKSTIEKLNTLLDKLNNGDGPAGRLISDKQMGEDLQKTVANLRKSSEELNSVAGQISNGNGLLSKLLHDKSLAEDTEQTIANLKKASAETETLLKQLNEGKGSLGKLNNDPALYDNLSATLVSLDSLLTDLKRKPNRYVRFTLF